MIISFKIVIVLLTISLLASPWLMKLKVNSTQKNMYGDVKEKDIYLQQLADLEYDYHMGKVNDDDYVLAKEEIQQKIIAAMPEVGKTEDVDEIVQSWLVERGIRV